MLPESRTETNPPVIFFTDPVLCHHPDCLSVVHVSLMDLFLERASHLALHACLYFLFFFFFYSLLILLDSTVLKKLFPNEIFILFYIYIA